jgi:hypothetical protein
MRYGDPELDRELRAENRKAGAWRRRVFIVVAALLVALLVWGILAAVTTPTVSAQSPEPPATPEEMGVTFESVGGAAWRVVEPDLDCDRGPFWPASTTAVAPDGRVWLLDYREGVRELGSCPLDIPPAVWG